MKQGFTPLEINGAEKKNKAHKSLTGFTLDSIKAKRPLGFYVTEHSQTKSVTNSHDRENLSQNQKTLVNQDSLARRVLVGNTLHQSLRSNNYIISQNENNSSNGEVVLGSLREDTSLINNQYHYSNSSDLVKILTVEKPRHKGFTLLEVIIAMALIALATGGALALVWQILGFTAISSSRLKASYLCQEGIELIKNIRDGNWLERRTNPGLLWDDGLEEGVWQDEYVNIGGVLSKFKRNITITKPSEKPHILEVLVEVSWEERGQEHQAVVEEHLYDWFKL